MASKRLFIITIFALLFVFGSLIDASPMKLKVRGIVNGVSKAAVGAIGDSETTPPAGGNNGTDPGTSNPPPAGSNNTTSGNPNTPTGPNNTTAPATPIAPQNSTLVPKPNANVTHPTLPAGKNNTNPPSTPTPTTNNKNNNNNNNNNNGKGGSKTGGGLETVVAVVVSPNSQAGNDTGSTSDASKILMTGNNGYSTGVMTALSMVILGSVLMA